MTWLNWLGVLVGFRLLASTLAIVVSLPLLPDEPRAFQVRMFTLGRLTEWTQIAATVAAAFSLGAWAMALLPAEIACRPLVQLVNGVFLTRFRKLRDER